MFDMFDTKGEYEEISINEIRNKLRSSVSKNTNMTLMNEFL